MKTKLFFNILLNTLLYAAATAKSIAKDEEIEVKLQFLEYELEDFCISKNEAEWKFLNGSTSNLRQLLDVELKESDFYKNELEVLQKHMGKKFPNEKLQRLLDIFSHPGAPLLGNMEFKEYRDYSIKLQQLLGTMNIECPEQDSSNLIEESNSTSLKTETNCLINNKKINTILFEEKNNDKLKSIWIKWYQEVEEKNKKTKYDFVQQLSILDLEAEQNGEEEVAEYWLKQSDVTSIDYETVKNLWNEIQPLYEKLRQYLISLISQKFGEGVFNNKKLIPAHLLGSLKTYDWVTAAEKLGAFAHSDFYKSLTSSLKEKKVEDLYKIADNLTADLGYLPQSFYKKSRFNESSQSCQSKRMNHCERDNVLLAMFCANEDIKVKNYIEINENVMKMKHLLLSSKEEEENGFLFREGPRDSALHEAIGGFSSLRALWTDNLKSQNLIKNTTQPKQDILNLLITALHMIPPLPYYLTSDLWRINALQEIDAAIGENAGDAFTAPSPSPIPESQQQEESNGSKSDPLTEQNYNVSMDPSKSYDTQNLTRDWWNYREKYQGLGSPNGKPYEDYLQDTYIIWNKPYLSKFLGTILQFQILEYLRTENMSTKAGTFQALMRKGKSQPWQILAEEMFNLTEISAKPLLKYFKPLEDFLDKRIKSKNQTPFFDFSDFNFLSQGFSLDSSNNKEEGEKPAEGSDALFFSLAVVAAIGLVAVIVTVGRRRYKKKRIARERKRRLAEL